MIKKNKKWLNVLSNQGFTLVETLVAITILLVVIVGPLSISSSTARSTSFSGEQVVAFFLAQEGLEIVHKVRDDVLLANNLSPTAWSVFTGVLPGGPLTTCYNSSGCGLEINTNTNGTLKTPVACTGTNCRLYYDTDGGRSRYTHTLTGNETTLYSRVINITNINANEAYVRSRVFWRTGSQRDVQEVIVESYLYNIYGS